MRFIDIPYFGEIDPFSVDEEYYEQIELRNVKVLLDLNFEAQWINPQRLWAVVDMLNNLTRIDSRNRLILHDQYHDPDNRTVSYYLEHLQEKVWRNALAFLIDFGDDKIPPREQMLSNMHLIRAGFYPDSDDCFAVFDYSIGLEYTELVLALNLDEHGDLQEITMEM